MGKKKFQSSVDSGTWESQLALQAGVRFLNKDRGQRV